MHQTIHMWICGNTNPRDRLELKTPKPKTPSYLSFLPVTSKRPVPSCFKKTTRWKEMRCDISPQVAALKHGNQSGTMPILPVPLGQFYWYKHWQSILAWAQLCNWRSDHCMSQNINQSYHICNKSWHFTIRGCTKPISMFFFKFFACSRGWWDSHPTQILCTS